MWGCITRYQTLFQRRSHWSGGMEEKQSYRGGTLLPFYTMEGRLAQKNLLYTFKEPEDKDSKIPSTQGNTDIEDDNASYPGQTILHNVYVSHHLVAPMDTKENKKNYAIHMVKCCLLYYPLSFGHFTQLSNRFSRASVVCTKASLQWPLTARMIGAFWSIYFEFPSYLLDTFFYTDVFSCTRAKTGSSFC